MIHCTFENGNKASLRHTTVSTVVLKNNKILMVKRIPEFLEGNKWGLIGGFVDRDETIKDAVAREVLEETGYKITNITLLTIRDNPDRPNEDRQNVDFVYFCDALKKEGEKDEESTKVEWFSFDNLPPSDQIAFDHYKDIELYLRYKKENLSLPILV